MGCEGIDEKPGWDGGGGVDMGWQVKVLGVLLGEEKGLSGEGGGLQWRPPGVASDHKEMAGAR